MYTNHPDGCCELDETDEISREAWDPTCLICGAWHHRGGWYYHTSCRDSDCGHG